ncbi:MAG TPA: hypothetical protein VKU61_10760 [Candidatus Binatia bacterium]|nr:hypothetical protein [Candidatus Binatia bacterium]
MRTVAAAVAFATAVLTPIAGSAVSPPCQRAIADGGAKFTKAALKIGQRCAIRAGAASCPPSAGGQTGNSAVDAAVARASSRLATRVRAACKRDDLSAFARPCRGADGQPLAVSDLVSCLRATHLEEVAQMLAIEFPALVPAAAEAGGCATNQACQCQCSPSGAFLDVSGHGS